MSTNTPEPSPEQFADWWTAALQRYPYSSVSENPGLAGACARLAYAAGWQARTGQLSLGIAESFPPGDQEIEEWADASDCVPPVTLVDEDDDDGYGLIFRPAQFYKTVRAALAHWGRPVPPPAEGDVGALQRLRHCPTHGQQPANAWGCPECVRELRQKVQLMATRSAPVAVSERPWEREAGWLDPDGECWWCPPDGPPYWQMANPAMVYGGWVLPAGAIPIPFKALPLPSEEVG